MKRCKPLVCCAGFFAGLVLASAAVADAPRLERIEPARVAPHQSFTLVLVGSGFDAGADVLIEGGTRGRFIRLRPRSLSSDRGEVVFALGYGPTPSERRLYVENPDGQRSEMLALEIAERAAAVETPTDVESGSGDDGAAATTGRGGAGESLSGLPVISALRPAGVPAGEPFILEILGSGFVPASEVRITVNVNAGSSRLPQYAPRRFEALFIDEELLEVELDRGFYPIPGARDVTVVNPGEAESGPAILRIEGEVVR